MVKGDSLKNKLGWALFVCLLVPMGANAMHPSITISDVKYTGTGCPRGSVSTSMTPNKGAINAVFDRFFTSISGKPSQQVKRCKLSLKLHIPKNKRVRLQQVRFRGFIDLSPNAYTRIVRNYRFGNSTKQVSRTWKGKSFQFVNQREPFNTRWSKCGRDVRLQVDSMMEVRSNVAARSQVGIDSFDNLMSRDYRGARGWKFILNYTSC